MTDTKHFPLSSRSIHARTYSSVTPSAFKKRMNAATAVALARFVFTGANSSKPMPPVG
ncbi:hypothetical protein PPTG_20791 [Phytophthora nicotianae INRA-310]|uniref:Uncharacterized protein n=1 Tax=Phytophthora nicotianae (strain INRA-310) TaxID=761204 RepID=W2RGV4_PHYN3|nr:hypothetical protein PPTG_20791 [Phytophthora nicotianae INRA-310]ETN24456.1 hypothetical protein PPTG_20791 [Phytophthora nicotianae INRA-310]